jgi:hypothetical protein
MNKGQFPYMKIRAWQAAVLLILLAAGAFLLTEARRQQPDDQTRILALLAEGEKAVEAKDLRATMSLVSRDYQDDTGNSRNDLRVYALGYYREVDQIGLAIRDPQIEVKEERARVDATAVMDVRTKGTLTSLRTSIPVILILAREPARRLLIFPDYRWRVIKVETMASLPDLGPFQGLW